MGLFFELSSDKGTDLVTRFAGEASRMPTGALSEFGGHNGHLALLKDPATLVAFHALRQVACYIANVQGDLVSGIYEFFIYLKDILFLKKAKSTFLS